MKAIAFPITILVATGFLLLAIYLRARFQGKESNPNFASGFGSSRCSLSPQDIASRLKEIDDLVESACPGNLELQELIAIARKKLSITMPEARSRADLFISIAVIDQYKQGMDILDQVERLAKETSDDQ